MASLKQERPKSRLKKGQNDLRPKFNARKQENDPLSEPGRRDDTNKQSHSNIPY